MRLQEEIISTALHCGRNPQEIRLLAVSKTFPADAVERAYAAGQTEFGENRVQEAQQKIPQVKETGLTWHLIGPLQSNKVRRAVELFHVIQTLDRPKIVRKLDQCAQELGKTLTVLVEVKIGAEPQKHGVLPEEIPGMVELVDSMPGLCLEGLMTVPPYHEEAEASRPYFTKMADLLSEINRHRHSPLKELSMGMSHDYRVAIEEGATLLRVGTAMFGPRSQ
ncbi:YggS family pyridoxal phosphate-dependent enzyme [Acidobacteria bacterium AH-259-D05]|nr:YggS family pyridoxal phosphate-dependent enzyme [Acidobacteria bacterium AH-259-D05]